MKSTVRVIFKSEARFTTRDFQGANIITGCKEIPSQVAHAKEGKKIACKIEMRCLCVFRVALGTNWRTFPFRIPRYVREAHCGLKNRVITVLG